MNTSPADDRIIVLNPSEEVSNISRSLTASGLVSILAAAETGDTRDLFALYRDVLCDNHVLAEFSTRKGAVLGDARNMMPFDKKNPHDVQAKDLCWPLAESDDFFWACSWLLNAVLYPVSVVEKVWQPSSSGFDLRYLRPVPFAMLDLSGSAIRIFDVSDGRILSTSHPADPIRYIVHRGHTMPVPDRWGGPMRSLLFWWLLRTQDRQWWASLLERYGTPFMKGTYKAGDDEGRRVLERAFALATKLGGIVLSAGTQAEIVQAAAGTAVNAHERFVELCNREMSRLIVGQTLSANTEATGMGAGTAELQGSVRDDLRKMDASLLAATLRSQLFADYCRINGNPGRPPLIVFGSDSAAEMKAMFAMVEALGKAGFEPDDDAQSLFAERSGFGIRRKPELPLMGLSASVVDRVTPSLHSDLSASFRGRLSPVARIIRDSSSPAECASKVKAWALAVSPGDASDLVAQALSAYAASGHGSALT